VLLLLFLPISPILMIIFGLLVGIAVVFLKQRLGMKNPIKRQEDSMSGDKSNRAADYYFADGI
ncbi:hypothetical protein AB4Z22_25760, partial [Paenibacillus sp. TAF58]